MKGWGQPVILAKARIQCLSPYNAVDLSQPAWLPAPGRNDNADSAATILNLVACQPSRLTVKPSIR